MHLSHPELDLWLIVLSVLPCIYYGVKEGMRAGVQKKPKFHPANHPLRRDGDKYAWYFYLAYRHCGPNSIVSRIPKLSAIATGVLAAYALKLVVAKGEQYDYDRTIKKTKVS